MYLGSGILPFMNKSSSTLARPLLSSATLFFLLGVSYPNMHFFLLIYFVVTICTVGVISTPVKHYSNPGDLESYNYSSLNEIEKRDFEYFGQLKSRPELTLISTQNLNGRSLRGYAFPQEAGKGIYIYHLEQVRYCWRMEEGC